MTTNSNILIIASATAKPGKEGELISALREVAEPTRAQPGCIQFGLYQLDGPGRAIVGIERWASAADHERHLAGAHFQRLASRMADLVAEPPRIVFHTVIDE
ncbi:MAG TPA: putative quinol monooxygenase [Caulobacteraceae bacterium]|nr:putative quinol monooxygenase [Caulobacteraceae bacterium]